MDGSLSVPIMSKLLGILNWLDDAQHGISWLIEHHSKVGEYSPLTYNKLTLSEFTQLSHPARLDVLAEVDKLCSLVDLDKPNPEISLTNCKFQLLQFLLLT